MDILIDIQDYFKSNLIINKTGYNKSILTKMPDLYKEYLSQFYDKFNANMIKDILNLYKGITFCNYCGKVIILDYQSFNSEEKFITNRKYCNSSCQMSDTDFYIQYKQKTGFDRPQHNPTTWENRIKNYQEKHGYDNPMQNPDVMNKRKELHFLEHGVYFPSEREEVKQKMFDSLAPKRKDIAIKFKHNYKAKTGYDNPMQNPDVFSSSTYKRKEYIFPSGEIIKIQGYENVALDKCLEKYLESEIITCPINMPKIEYHNLIKNTMSTYYPDLYIPKDNLIIEVKSTYTYKANYEINLLKKDACLKLGYNFQFWICSNKEILQILNYDAGACVL